ncbi:MAG: endonuclease MutS2 [Anaerolineales bacterium]|nr:endonuclease MutS2 [Anaerolineales bacterium]
MTLELPKILKLLQDRCAFSASRDLAGNLLPTPDAAEARQRQRETSEARLLLSLHPSTTIGGARNIRAEIKAASHGILLEPEQCLDIKNTLIAARSQLRFFEKEGSQFPILAGTANTLQPPPGLIDRISRTMDDRGQILDDASPKLQSIRSESKIAHARLMSKLDRLVNDPARAKLLQENIITQRDGRYVVPLKADHKGRIKGIIHDRSASGATLFIEPTAVVELNNQVRELELAERDEIRRILSELTEEIAGHADNLYQLLDSLADLDLAFAKARFADDLEASEPILHPNSGPDAPAQPIFRLLGARHPLLHAGSVVPIDLKLDQDVLALIITGPNTGGKTVTLKTAGVLALMAQCGLHIPAISGSEMSVFSSIFADIGDEQSIEQSLSTFSGHIANITRILKHADEHSLVLLDELGAGTDPQEGAALAQSLLTTFLDRKCLTLIATHYPELKGFAHTTSGVQNASLEFDLESLQPTYRLLLGLPGRSNALAIAERLGLDPVVIKHARSLLKPDELQTDGLLDEILRQRDEAERSNLAARDAHRDAEAIQQELAAQLESIEAERTAILEAARQQALEQAHALQEEISGLRKELSRARQPLEAVKELEKDAEKLEEQLSTPAHRKTSSSRKPRRPFKVGDRVHIQSIDTSGTISGLNGDQAEVQIGQLRIQARLDELNTADEPTPAPARKKPVVKSASAKQTPSQTSTSQHSGGKRPAVDVPPLEIDLRGFTADDAIDKLEKHFDNAYLVDMPFLYIIHGKGSGRLRESIRIWLKSNPYVQSFNQGGESEGGDGVTVVKFKGS